MRDSTNEELLFYKLQRKLKKLNLSIFLAWFLLFFLSYYIIFLSDYSNLSITNFLTFLYIFIIVAGIFIFGFSVKIGRQARKNIESLFSAIATTRNNFWLIFENAPFPVIIYDKEKKIRFINNEALIISQYKKNELNQLIIDKIFKEKEKLLRETSPFFLPRGEKTELITKFGYTKHVLIKVHKINLGNETLFNAIVIDITNETKMRKKLEEIDKINNVTQNLALSGGCKYYPDKNKIIPTKSFHKIFGLPEKAEYSFEEFLEKIETSKKKSLLIRLDNLSQKKDSFIFEYELKNEVNGRKITLRHICELDIEKNGERVIWGAFYDISEINWQKEVLINEKEKYYTILNNLPLGIILLDVSEIVKELHSKIQISGNDNFKPNFTSNEIKSIISKVSIIEINKEFLDFFGLEIRNLLPEHFIKLFNENDIKNIGNIFPFLLGEKPSMEKTIKLIHPIEKKTAEISLLLRKYTEESREYLIIIARNISWFKKVQNELRNTNKTLKNFLNTIPFYVISYDKNANLIFVNDKAEELFGDTKHNLLRKNFFDFYADDNERREQFFHIKNIIDRSETTSLNFSNLIKTPKGNKRIFWYNEIIYDEFTKPDGIIALGIDITDENRKKAELNKSYKELIELKNILESRNIELERAREILKERERLLQNEITEKDKIFSVIAHDIRSPFSGLLAGLQLINDNFNELDNDELENFISNSYSSAKRVFALIESLLEWARARLNKLDLENEQINIKEKIDQILLLFEAQAKQKEIELINSTQENICIFSDKSAFEIIIRNLVSNALKFTHRKGKIEVGARFFSDKIIEITVKDNGVGIPQENLSKVFMLQDKFSTLGTEEERGTGMGLKVVGEYVKKLGGKIYVDSLVGKGTTFIIHLQKSSCDKNTK